MRSPLVWAVLLSATAVSLSQPNDWLLAGSPFLALVAWVPLFWALRRSASNRAAAGLGALFGLITILAQNYWLAFFQNFAVWTIGGVALTFAGYCALLGPVLRTLLQRQSAARPFLVGAAWAVFEFLKSNGFLGFPWGLAPYPFHQWPWFVQIVDITGMSFLTFLIVAWNAWLAEALETTGYFLKTSAAFFAAILVCLAAYGTWRLTEQRPSRGTMQVALIQQNSDPWNSGDDLGPLSISVGHSRQALREGRPDLVVWSETSLRLPLQDWRPYYERMPPESPLLKTIRTSRAWWLFGNPYFQEFNPEKDIRSGAANAAVLMNPQAQIADYYGKIHLVPFAEYIPFWEIPMVKAFFQTVVGQGGTWDLGRRWTIFEVPVRGPAATARFATPICFEDTFPWLNSVMVRNGAEVLINLTNDSWSRRDSSQVQHHVAALFRTIENRVWMVRSSNAGVTSVIDPTGQVAAGPLPYFKDAHMLFDLPLPKTRTITPYTLYGDWLVLFFALTLIAELVWNVRRRS